MSAYSSLSFISQGDAAVSLRTKSISIKGVSELLITLYGEAYSLLDIAFEYKLKESDDWKTDAVLISGKGLNGNTLIGLECSISGVQHIVYWNHESNNLSNGQECLTRIRILSSSTVFLSSELGTWVERISSHEPELFINKFAINKDRSGNLLCISGNSIEIYDSEGTYISSIAIPGIPSFALQKTDGNYLILDSENSVIVEYKIGSGIERTIDLSSYLTNSQYLSYDEITKNLLISGGDIPKVYEFTYGDGNYGTLLWEYGDGTIGNGIGQLNTPVGVSYAEDRSIIYIADSGNNRIVKVNRKTDPEILNSIPVGSAIVSLNSPKFIQAGTNEDLLIVEGQGEQELYSRDSSTHPALVRYKNSNPNRDGDKNNLPEYNNLFFTPLMGVIYDNVDWQSSSSSSLSSSSLSSLSSSSLSSSSSSKSSSSRSSSSSSP